MTLRPSLVIFCGVLSLLATSASGEAGSRADAEAALNRGLAALDRGDPRTARVELMNAIKADPRFAPARVAQARTLLALGNGAAAQEALDRAIALGTSIGSVRHLRAQADLQQGKPDEALIEARATDADPAQAQFLARMEGQALQAKGDYRQAASAFQKAVDLAPDDSATWADIARLHLATGTMADAITATDLAVELAPESVDALTLRAMIAREQYGLQAATGWFDAALKQNPNHVPALVEFAATRADMGQASRALALTRRALSLAPGNPRAYFIQAVIASRAGRYDLARSLLTRTGGALDGQPATRLLRGVLHIDAGNATLATAEFRALLEAQPLNLRARLLLSRALYDDGQYAEAERALFPIVERADAGSYALTLAAHIHEALGDGKAAAEFQTRAVAMATGPAQVYRGAGNPGKTAAAANVDLTDSATNVRHVRALLEAGQVGAALLHAGRVVAANPGAPFAAIMLGDCQMAAGRYFDAAASYERAGNMRFDRDIALRLVDAWQRAGRSDKAERVLGLFLAQDPMNVEGQRLAASFLLAAGKYDRALAILSGLRARLGNQDTLLMTDIARAYVGLGKGDRALAFAAHAYRIKPASAVASDIFGWALFNARPKDRRAVELLEKAQLLAPAEPLVQLHLGKAYAAFGEKEQARRLLRAAATTPHFAKRAEAMIALKAL
ncbi:MAG: tetratricopeptide repeat protein [Sphingobium sp.]